MLPPKDQSLPPFDGPLERSSRRSFVLASLGILLTGCATEESLTTLPGPAWDAYEPARPEPSSAADSRRPRQTDPAGIIARSRWAGGQPVPSLMNRMAPVRYITVHHDGMQPFTSTDVQGTAHRLESIRRGHRGRGWGDIGYHFAVDRAGRVWEARPLVYQGAHVKDHNPSNIGVVALGNFDRQMPSDPQVSALTAHVSRLMRAYRVPVARVRTHQEWAATACPGKYLQRYMVAARNNGHMRA